MDGSAAVSALSALAHEARLRVFRALVGAGPDGMTPGALGPLLDIPASTLSFHLKELAAARLVVAEREGRRLHYRPVFRRMNELMGYLVDHCCEGAACDEESRDFTACPPSAPGHASPGHTTPRHTTEDQE